MRFDVRVRTAIGFAAAVLLAFLGGSLIAPRPVAAEFRAHDDVRHVKAVLEALRRAPPTKPLVLLLGGSAARECITNERSWRRQIAAAGVNARAYNLAYSSQSYENGIDIVRALPDARVLVLIGVNLGRYTVRPPEDIAAVRVARAAAVYDSHRFHDGQQLSDGAKRQLVRRWLVRKYPLFKERYAGNAAALRKLVNLCQERGFRPVLVELPLNLPIVRRSLDAPRGRYRASCRGAAKDYGVPYVDFIGRIGLTSHDFVDIAHLVEPGRVKYQRRLSRLAAVRLRQFGLIGSSEASMGSDGTAPSTTATPLSDSL